MGAEARTRQSRGGPSGRPFLGMIGLNAGQRFFSLREYPSRSLQKKW
jgi:hypothetical protein